MGFWYYEDFEESTRYGVMTERTIFEERTPFQHVEIIETRLWGRALVIDGFFMTTEREEHYYHEMITHPALTIAPRITSVLVIGGGDGGTAREVLRHPGVGSLTMVEIDEGVVKACREHLPALCDRWDDPRLKVRFEDGIAFAASAPAGSFDVVILDGCDPVGPAEGLFTPAFYADCARLLSPGGVFALQTGSPILQRRLFESTTATLMEIFPAVTPYFGPAPVYASGQWSWTLASSGHDPTAIREYRIGPVAGKTKYYNREIHLGAFAVPNDLKAVLER